MKLITYICVTQNQNDMWYIEKIKKQLNCDTDAANEISLLICALFPNFYWNDSSSRTQNTTIAEAARLNELMQANPVI